MQWTVIVLAGGKGRRIGRDKALEKINTQTLIERTIDCVSQLGREIIVVTSERSMPLIRSLPLVATRATLTTDLVKDKGPIGGVHTGLKASHTFYNLVVACDMPFLNLSLLQHLMDVAPGYNLVIPKIGEMVEPLQAIYSKDCLVAIDIMMSEDRLQINELINMVRTRFVPEKEIDIFDPGRLAFFNINTDADLERAKLILSKTSSRCVRERRNDQR